MTDFCKSGHNQYALHWSNTSVVTESCMHKESIGMDSLYSSELGI